MSSVASSGNNPLYTRSCFFFFFFKSCKLNDGPRRSCLDSVPAAFLSEAWHQEAGCLLNQAEVNMPCEEKGGNIPQMALQQECVSECSA